VSVTEAEAEIIKNCGPLSVEERIDFAEQLAEQAEQMYASAWASCPEIKCRMILS
jgi:hypothetical protein